MTVSLKYIPVKMKLDPRESINNMGQLRVDVLDAADLPSADRNGYSDPYCKFKLDGETVFKTKVQKKTLHPAWNEFFECPIKSRIGADLKLDVYDWDFGDKADFLGGAPIPLDGLEPFKSEEVTVVLDGKSGVVRLKLLFKPDYVIRARQGTSTFSGTFAAPGKIVGAPVKGVGMIGGGVIKGASFLKQGFMRVRGGSKEDADFPAEVKADGNGEDAAPVGGSKSLKRSPVLADGLAPAQQPAQAAPSPAASPASHSRSRSSASQFGDRLTPGAPGLKGDLGTATFTVVSTSGFPPSANMRVVIKQATSKGMKEIHKTKTIKGQSGTVQFDQSNETFRVPSVSAETQFAVIAKDHSTFGSDEVFGEAIFFVDDQGSSAGRERSIKVGTGVVNVKTAFMPSEAGSVRPGTAHSQAGTEDALDSPERKPRRSFLSKRVPSGSNY